MHLPIYLKRERWYCIVLNTLSKGSKRALAIRILTYFKVFKKKNPVDSSLPLNSLILLTTWFPTGVT